jgi:hypothetical protein
MVAYTFAVSFASDFGPVDTVRGSCTANRAQTAAFRALKEASKQRHNRHWRSVVVVLEKPKPVVPVPTLARGRPFKPSGRYVERRPNVKAVA